MARVVAELYRIENVIYVRIKASGKPWSGPTAKLLRYRQVAAPSGRMITDEGSLEGTSPLEPARV